MTELVKHEQIHTPAALPERLRYAEAMAVAKILPDAFRREPANILVAMEVADALEMRPYMVMQEMAVISGRPSFSAKFMRALVRRAGHKLRESFDQGTGTARAVIVRADDPEFEHTAHWNQAKAQQHGYWGKGHWAKNPELMLKNRALSECVREACPEVLGGVAYTPDEIQDFSGGRQEPRNARGFGISANMPARTPRETEVVEVTHQDDGQRSYVPPIDPATDAMRTDEQQEAPATPEPSTRSQWIRLGNALDAVGITEKADKTDAIVSWATSQGVQDVASAKDLTAAQIEDLIAELANDPDAQNTAAQEVPQS